MNGYFSKDIVTRIDYTYNHANMFFINIRFV